MSPMQITLDNGILCVWHRLVAAADIHSILYAWNLWGIYIDLMKIWDGWYSSMSIVYKYFTVLQVLHAHPKAIIPISSKPIYASWQFRNFSKLIR